MHNVFHKTVIRSLNDLKFTYRNRERKNNNALFESEATKTMTTNKMAELKQQIPTFSNPTNQMSSTRK